MKLLSTDENGIQTWEREDGLMVCFKPCSLFDPDPLPSETVKFKLKWVWFDPAEAPIDISPIIKPRLI